MSTESETGLSTLHVRGRRKDQKRCWDAAQLAASAGSCGNSPASMLGYQRWKVAGKVSSSTRVRIC